MGRAGIVGVLGISTCVILLVGFGACRGERQDDHDGASAGAPGAAPAEAGTITGTITYVDVEGGFYGIVTDDGAKLDPVNLPEEFRQEGLRVRARVQRLEDRVSIHMWGRLVRVLEIERL
jgi:hypothetical protein